MNYLRIGAAVLALSAVVFAWGQYRQIGLQEELIKNQAEVIETAIQNMEVVKNMVEESRYQMSELLMAQGQVQSSLSARQQELRRLQNDVQEIRIWADQSLPADIVRLRQRSTARGAADYGQSVPASGAVRDAGGKPANERGAESGVGAN